MTNKAEDKFYFGNIGTKEESELTVRITKMLAEVEQARLSRNEAKAKSLAAKVRDMIRKSANVSTAKMQMEELQSIMQGASFSRPGQPEKFASSLDRGSFAEASTSPMLGKLLAAKVMPEGGWRAVQVGSDTLVISFEDADLARDFGRRAATKGYNATSPVQAIGRYWNVEVKNG